MRNGFTLLEVMIGLAIVAGLLLTVLSVLHRHLGIAGRQAVLTEAVSLARAKIADMERSPGEEAGRFPAPQDAFSFATQVSDAEIPGIREIRVRVTCDGESVVLRELIRK